MIQNQRRQKIKRTIVISDVHGCIEELHEFLDKISYSSNDRIIFVGDLIGKGPNSIEVIKKVQELNLESLKGNHENRFLKWFKNPKSYDKLDFYSKFDDKDISFINFMPISIRLSDNLFVVHAGFRPGISVLEQSKQDMLSIRYLDDQKKIFWTSQWNGESIIYGHTVHSLDKPLIEIKNNGCICYGLDTGCVYGGYLTGLIVETREIVQVKAKKVYCQKQINQ